jgi:hypothetical protein
MPAPKSDNLIIAQIQDEISLDRAVTSAYENGIHRGEDPSVCEKRIAFAMRRRLKRLEQDTRREHYLEFAEQRERKAQADALRKGPPPPPRPYPP